MRSSTAMLLGCLALVILAGCGDGQAAAPSETEPTVAVSSPPSSGDRSRMCAELVSDEVLQAMGWPVGGRATERLGRCERRSGNSVLVVGSLPTVASGEAQQERARSAYDEGCAGLFRSGSATPDTDASWLGADVTACFRALPTGKKTGVAELFQLTADSQVVHVQVRALRPTTRAQLRQGLTLVTERAESVF